MIPFASQRGLGQDLATHLLNTQDNEYAEIEGIRGAIAGDLHGAFAEWEAQAHALTKCKNYLYSMSVNPDPAQGEITREQYLDYIARAEEKLGLENQPRAIVFHIKEGREHCHVIWSRIDTTQEKAVHMAFDRDKLMMVSRQFAKDHNLELPAGYHSKEESQNKQLSLYEMHQKRSTGISKEEHMEVVTDAWKHSDSAKAFVQALAQRGYVLATGKRPYVLVDFYGHTNSLPKLINDKSVRTKDIRAFLKKDYAPELLPSVDEAKALVAEHRNNIEVFAKDDQKIEEIKSLKRKQEQRRQSLEAQQSTMRQRQHDDRLDLAQVHKAERIKIRDEHIAETKQIVSNRYKIRPTGLAAFLGRVSGVELLRSALHKYQDRKRTKTYVFEKQELKAVQNVQQGELQRRHAMQALDLTRKEKALHKIEIREMKSLDEGIKKEARIAMRGGENHIPPVPLDLAKSKTATLASDMDHREKYEMQMQLEGEFEQAASGRIKQKKIDLEAEFTRAAKGQDEEKERSSSEGRKPAEDNKIRRYKRTRKRDLDKDRGR